MTRGLLAACCLLLLSGTQALTGSEQAPIRITAPAEGALLEAGDLLVVEVALDPRHAGSPVSLRVDGKSIAVSDRAPYSFQCDSRDWAVGEHALTAVAFLVDRDLASSAVRVRVAAREGAVPEDVQTILFDDFADGTLDSETWRELNADPAVSVLEVNGVLRISGVTSYDRWIEEGASTAIFGNQDIAVDVDFRMPRASGPGRGIVYLQLLSPDSPRAFAVFCDTANGYAVEVSAPTAVGEYAPRFGDEASEWHTLSLTYAAGSGIARGYVDASPLGSFHLNLGRLRVALAFATETAGMDVAVDLDNLRVSRHAPTESPGVATQANEPEAAQREHPSGTAAPHELFYDEPLIPGGFALCTTRLGDYYEYVPSSLTYPVRAVVVVHGSIGENETAWDAAKTYAERIEWVWLAGEYGLVLVAPIFDREHFGGYRALGGRDIGADEFLMAVIDSYAHRAGEADPRFFLFGHSAGSQFAHRFLLTHPERVIAAALSAAGNYAFPDDAVRWPFGRRDSPRPEQFVEACSVPATVFVGSLDTEEDLMAPWGVNRIERGQNWVAAMQALADEHGVESRIRFVLIPNVGHSSRRTGPSCARWFAECLDQGF
jgi:pimeloyl-ACP methyl ester carboxylesterase